MVQSYSPAGANVHPRLTHVLPWAHWSPHPTWHLDCFSHFCTMQVRDRQTDRQTDHATPSLGLTIGCTDTERWCGPIIIIIITTCNIITCMWSFRSNYLHYSWIFTAAESETWLADLIAVVGFAAVHEPPLRTHLWNDIHQHSSHDNMTQLTTAEQLCTNKVLQFLPARR